MAVQGNDDLAAEPRSLLSVDGVLELDPARICTTIQPPVQPDAIARHAAVVFEHQTEP